MSTIMLELKTCFVRFYPVLASILGSHGHVVCTVSGQSVSKMDPETVFEKPQLFNASFDRFGDQF